MYWNVCVVIVCSGKILFAHKRNSITMKIIYFRRFLSREFPDMEA